MYSEALFVHVVSANRFVALHAFVFKALAVNSTVSTARASTIELTHIYIVIYIYIFVSSFVAYIYIANVAYFSFLCLAQHQITSHS